VVDCLALRFTLIIGRVSELLTVLGFSCLSAAAQQQQHIRKIKTIAPAIIMPLPIPSSSVLCGVGGT